MSDLIVDFPQERCSCSDSINNNRNSIESNHLPSTPADLPSTTSASITEESKRVPSRRIRSNSLVNSLTRSLTQSLTKGNSHKTTTKAGKKTTNNSNSKSHRKSRSVDFSPTSEMTYFQRHADAGINLDEIWYAPRDYKTMKAENKRNVLAVHRIIRASSTYNGNAGAGGADQGGGGGGGHEHEELLLDGCMLTGLEHLCTPSIIRKSKERRAKCIRAVLDAQARHEESEELVHHQLSSSGSSLLDVWKQLAWVSMEHSSWSVKRARTVASLRVAGEHERSR